MSDPHIIKPLYERVKVLRDNLKDHEDSDTLNTKLNGALALLIKNGEHPVKVGERTGLSEKEVRDRVTLDEPGLVHSDPADFCQAADFIEDNLKGQVTPKNLAAAPLVRLTALLRKMASEYERSTAAQRTHNARKAAANG